MSKGSKKSAKARNATITQTAKRHTSVPVLAAAAVIDRPETEVAPPVAEPIDGAPVATAVVTPIEVTPTEATASVTEAGISVAVVTPIEVASAPVIDGQIVAGLIGDLRHEYADIAREAAIALGETGSSAAVEALIDVLENADGFYHSVVRSAAAASLAKLGDKRAVSSLLCAVNDTMAEASAEAVRALADLGDARAVDTLVGVVQNVTGFFQPVVRLAAVHALCRFDAPQAAAELAHVAADPDEDAVIRDAASE